MIRMLYYNLPDQIRPNGFTGPFWEVEAPCGCEQTLIAWWFAHNTEEPVINDWGVDISGLVADNDMVFKCTECGATWTSFGFENLDW